MSANIRTRLLHFALGAGLIVAGAGAACAAGSVVPGATAQKTKAIEYFLGHSLGFAPIFNLYHHSPGWILHRRKQLKLTKAQDAEEKHYAHGMQKQTGADIAILKQAYKTYAADAARTDPSLTLIKRDVDRVGRAQTRLALEMVPFHLQGYDILTPPQRATYAKLETAFIKSLSLSMYADTSFGTLPSRSSR